MIRRPLVRDHLKSIARLRWINKEDVRIRIKRSPFLSVYGDRIQIHKVHLMILEELCKKRLAAMNTVGNLK